MEERALKEGGGISSQKHLWTEETLVLWEDPVISSGYISVCVEGFPGDLGLIPCLLLLFYP